MIRSILNAILIVIVISLLSLLAKLSSKPKQGPSVCPKYGPGSAEPSNSKEFVSNMHEALRYITSKGNGERAIYTTINSEAANNNLLVFVQSLAIASPALLDCTIIVCLDQLACGKCRTLHDEKLCVFMDLGISGNSLAPGFGGQIEKEYWRLTYGRVFATLTIHSFNISVLAVDVDSIFFKNPFASGQVLQQHPDEIGVVHDVKPFQIYKRDKSVINGGFLYFPATSEVVRAQTKLVLDRIWAYSCFPSHSEQHVTSKVLRDVYTESLRSHKKFQPTLLPQSQYLSFCNTNCANKNFSKIASIGDLKRIEASFLPKSTTEATCGRVARKDWVFFHTACVWWGDGRTDEVSKRKGAAQKALFEWVLAS